MSALSAPSSPGEKMSRRDGAGDDPLADVALRLQAFRQNLDHADRRVAEDEPGPGPHRVFTLDDVDVVPQMVVVMRTTA